MNPIVLLATAFAALHLGTMRSLLVRYFPHLPVMFDSTTTPADHYDFVIVGAGCGGSVMASRLSETSASVLLLEAGGSSSPESATPFMDLVSRLRDPYWVYELKEQKHGYLGYIDQKGQMAMGKVMGGTSSTNGMIYNRGNKMDYDSWARLGNTGWDYDSVLPYFKKSESLDERDFPVKEMYHGRSGLLSVKRKYFSDGSLLDYFLQAGQQLGFNIVDPNSPKQIGVSPSFETVKGGVRATASETFLRPVVDRPNLQIRTNAVVSRVLFNRRNRAVGVEYTIDGRRRVVLARKEVILSAGVVETPHLLMLSGVGPREHLQEMGIPVVAAVEGVGKNLHEHPNLFLTYSLKEGVIPSPLQLISPKLLREYLVNQTGPLSNGGVSGQGFAWVNVGGELPPSYPDMILALASLTPASAGSELTEDTIGLKPEIFDDVFGGFGDKPTFAIILQMARPKSRGTITLKSKNPSENPIIDFKLFDHPDDIKLFVKAIRKTQEFMRTPAMRVGLQARESDKILTPCSRYGRDTDGYWECYARHLVLVGYHPTSTAMMAPASNPLGVVSPTLRVRGVTGLRVVDASVMPHNIGGNPMATIYMIAEKAADIIKEDWGYFTEFIS